MYFVKKGSIVREIWGDGDTILFIFAGASAEFALNKAVDWLYYTGKLPADPLGRLFSTVEYARKIVFSEKEAALKAIDKITAIHQGVEASREAQIPDWAYRDVLFMLIDYSIRSFEVLKRELNEEEKSEVFEVFNRVGLRMNINGLPKNLLEWRWMRQDHLERNLISSDFTINLYQQYRKHLGYIRFQSLKKAQALVAPEKVSLLLSLTGFNWLKPMLKTYRLLKRIKLHSALRNAILPRGYCTQIQNLDVEID